jgi:glycerophosphoryl diester phosphodiesterase
MKYRQLYLLSLLFIYFSCSKNATTLPPYNPDTNLNNTLPIDDTIMRKMEGIYKLSGGNINLGEEFVCKVSRNRVSFFSNLDGIFMILKYGLNPKDSSIQFSGFWRYSENALQGKISFAISKADGSMDLIFSGIVENLKLNGFFLDEDLVSKEISLQFNRHFSQYTQNNDFAIFAHHGVQTTANPPYAENSLDGVLNDEDYGVNGLEFDVRMTKDSVPICMHDPSIDVRLTLKGPLSGAYDQYDFSLLTKYIRLEDGQLIPSVEQVLTAFVEKTNLKYMWLDIKGNPGIFRRLEPLVKAAYARAAELNRKVVIFADLPSQEVIDEYKTQPGYYPLPTMCELTLQDVIDNNCQYWGPRYTEGLFLDQVEKAHNMGIKVYSWTLNDKNLIVNYLKNGKFDGFISDYPAYVVYNYYTMF